MKLLIDNPSTWKTTISFLFLSTLLILFIGWLVISGILPIDRAIDYSNEQIRFLKVWMTVAIFVGILLPAIVLVVWIRHSKPRKILGFYLLVLIVQIVTERFLSRILFSSITVAIGTIYTAFRLWQLWQGRKVLTADTRTIVPKQKLLNGLLWLMLLFWLSNLLMLFLLPWRMISQHT